MTGTPTPIAFFAFNRPEHTRRALEAIQKNPLSAQTTLYAFCDGPRLNESSDGLLRISEVRQIILEKEWCRETVTRFRDSNAGLKQSLLSGVSEIARRHGRVIVIEDDVQVSRGFLQFMNDALDLYEDEPRVMHVSGYSVLQEIPQDYPFSTYVLNHTLVGWGWATWHRAWEKLSTDGAYLRREVDRLGIKHYVNLDGAYDIYWTLKFLDDGRSEDWNAYWHASVLVHGGICINPVLSLASNSGFDGSGTQCEIDSHQARWPTTDHLNVTQIDLSERLRFRKIMSKRPFRVKAGIIVKDWARRVIFAGTVRRSDNKR